MLCDLKSYTARGIKGIPNISAVPRKCKQFMVKPPLDWLICVHRLRSNRQIYFLANPRIGSPGTVWTDLAGFRLVLDLTPEELSSAVD